jgi:hypothetical protein
MVMTTTPGALPAASAACTLPLGSTQLMQVSREGIVAMLLVSVGSDMLLRLLGQALSCALAFPATWLCPRKMELPLAPDTLRKQLQLVVAVTTTSPVLVVKMVMVPRLVPGLLMLGVLSAMSNVTTLPGQAGVGLQEPAPGGRRHLWVLPAAASPRIACSTALPGQ